MRLLSRPVIALILGLPVSALAQGPRRADLVGVWVHSSTYNGPDGTPRTDKNYVVFRDDSTWTMGEKLNDKEVYRKTGRWMVSNDSLWLGDVSATDTVYYFGSEYTGAQIKLKFPAQKVEVNSGKLRMTDYQQFAKWHEDHQGKKPYPAIWFHELTKSTEPEP